MAPAPLPLSSPSSGGFTDETKRKVLDTLGFQSMQLEQSTWCVALPLVVTSGGMRWRGAGGCLPKCPSPRPTWGKDGYPPAMQGAGIHPVQSPGTTGAVLDSHLLLPFPSEGRGAFPGAEIYHMVEQVNGHLKESILKALEEER